jgi:hypothetical protein
MALISRADYAKKIGKCYSAVAGRINQAGIYPVSMKRFGDSRMARYMYNEKDLNKIRFYEKSGRPRNERKTNC